MLLLLYYGSICHIFANMFLTITGIICACTIHHGVLYYSVKEKGKCFQHRNLGATFWVIYTGVWVGVLLGSALDVCLDFHIHTRE